MDEGLRIWQQLTRRRTTTAAPSRTTTATSSPRRAWRERGRRRPHLRRVGPGERQGSEGGKRGQGRRARKEGGGAARLNHDSNGCVSSSLQVDKTRPPPTRRAAQGGERERAGARPPPIRRAAQGGGRERERERERDGGAQRKTAARRGGDSPLREAEAEGLRIRAAAAARRARRSIPRRERRSGDPRGSGRRRHGPARAFAFRCRHGPMPRCRGSGREDDGEQGRRRRGRGREGAEGRRHLDSLASAPPRLLCSAAAALPHTRRDGRRRMGSSVAAAPPPPPPRPGRRARRLRPAAAARISRGRIARREPSRKKPRGSSIHRSSRAQRTV
ncbi:hypothetical protein PVAP13_9NG849478 [Panicum virgatum]|uniref:Uncharacterized protein n=1 Tax=Panicum virgatum TaxID=38727 RepID=A0A8T0N1K4_PANVG|nr:hypothetical protein PVAP13_9NG849478 [Panicum virgatum]